jgi:V8-like Glu-specific endopeptidase
MFEGPARNAWGGARMHRRTTVRQAVALTVVIVLAGCSLDGGEEGHQSDHSGKADQGGDPGQSGESWALCTQAVRSSETVPVVNVPAIEASRLRAEDLTRDANGLAPRFAAPATVLLTPGSHGSWTDQANGVSQWRLRIRSEGSTSLNFGFDRFSLPKGARLFLFSADCSSIRGPFTEDDNEAHGQLWTPIVPGQETILHLSVPASSEHEVDLAVSSVNRGYRDFQPVVKSGSCNVDVVCGQADGWRDQIRSVAAISTGGSLFCTGVLVNNTSRDRTPYFMTANHCGIRQGNAASLVVYWNYETSTCGGVPDGTLNQFQTGSVFRAGGAGSDFTLVELDDDPPAGAFVYWAGWDNSSNVPNAAVAIHHPSVDEKRISFEHDPLMATAYSSEVPSASATHLRVIDWDVGTTEPGSSGSPLFDQDGRVVGQLHGGAAACGNDRSDWYGWFHVSWAAGLKDWLDAAATGETAIDGMDSL